MCMRVDSVTLCVHIEFTSLLLTVCNNWLSFIHSLIQTYALASEHSYYVLTWQPSLLLTHSN